MWNKNNRLMGKENNSSIRMISLSIMNHRTKHKINKKTEDLNNTGHQLHLTVRCRTPHPPAAECTIYSHAHGRGPGIGHMLAHKTSHNKFFKVWRDIKCLFQSQWMKVEINNLKFWKNP